MPTTTGNVLVLYGHGCLTATEGTFNFQRPANAVINLYSWTREGIPVRVREVLPVANTALAYGRISNSYATFNTSRIRGVLLKDYEIESPLNFPLPPLPPLPVPDFGDPTSPNFAPHQTAINIQGIPATVYHNNATIALSNRMLLMVDPGAQNIVLLSSILSDPNFLTRTMDVMWCACKVNQ